MTRPSIVMTAGGTGGHLFPAKSLAQELSWRGYAIDLITDMRSSKFDSDFPAREVYRVRAATFKGRSPIEATKTVAKLSSGFHMAYRILGEIKPQAVIGFGGYPTIPPMLAALTRGIPTLTHEQNAVMGRANRLLGPMVRAVAYSFEDTKFLEGKLLNKAYLTGTPLRRAVLNMRTQVYNSPPPDGQLNLLVFGGSQGARFFAEIMPAALYLLPEHIRDRLLVVQQCREEDIENVFDAYERAGVAAELATFFDDLPERMATSHLVVSRAGATTIAELCCVGRPAVLVPLPHSLDNDQYENATRFERGGGGWVYEEAAMTSERFAGVVRRLFEEPGSLIRAASAAKAMARYDAVERLADVVESVIEQKPSDEQARIEGKERAEAFSRDGGT